MLKCYRLDGVTGLINETREDVRKRQVLSQRYRAWSFQPGDIVRPQLFEDDEGTQYMPPLGLVLWCVNNNESDAIGILWSGDPDGF